MSHQNRKQANEMSYAPGIPVPLGQVTDTKSQD